MPTRHLLRRSPIGPAAYAAALIFTFLFASRLLGTAAGLLAAAFLAHQLRWIFLRTWTEPVVIALLLALLALLTRSATPRRAAAGGLLVGVALLVRNSELVPLLALGGLAYVLGGENRLRQLLLFGGGASIALAGLLLGEGQAYPPQIIIETGELPRRELSNMLGELFRQTRWDIAGLVLLAALRVVACGTRWSTDRPHSGKDRVYSGFCLGCRIVCLSHGGSTGDRDRPDWRPPAGASQGGDLRHQRTSRLAHLS